MGLYRYRNDKTLAKAMILPQSGADAAPAPSVPLRLTGEFCVWCRVDDVSLPAEP